MSQYKDFDGEFLPVKEYTAQELHSDKFILRLSREKKLNKQAKSGEIANYLDTHILEVQVAETPLKPRRKLMLTGTSELKSELNKKKRRRVVLVGTNALNELLERRNAKEKEKTNLEVPAKKRRFIRLIPFPQTESPDSEDEFVDARLEFHELTEGELKGLEPGENDHVTQIELPVSDSDEYEEAGVGENVEGSLLGEKETVSLDSTQVSGRKELPSLESVSHSKSKPERKKKVQIIPFKDFRPAEASNGNVNESSDQKEAEEGNDFDGDIEMEEELLLGELTAKLAEQTELQEGQTGDNEVHIENVDSDLQTQQEQSPSESESISMEPAVSSAVASESSSSSFHATASDVTLMKQTIKLQLSGLSFPLLQKSSLAEPYKEVYTLIEHTIRDSEGHSTLLVGPRGSGKTLITDTAISNLRDKYGQLFVTIKLNAFLHSDDNLAIREIARQLDLHSRLEGGNSDTTTFEQRAISDTFTNILLALDSRIPGHRKLSVRVVILIDEMERFTGGKQTLLYNLFEFSQNLAIPICVVGISTKITTRELLEKRVRSRFSQRIISIGRAPTMDEFWYNSSLNLKVPEECMAQFDSQEYPKKWNQHIDQLFTFPSGLKKVIYKVFYSTRNYKDVYCCCQLPVSCISESCPFPQSEKFEVYLDQVSAGDVQSIVESLSSLELLLALAAARWVEKAEVPHVNFNLAYKEYSEMVKQLNVEATTVSGNSFMDSTILAGVKVSQKLWSPKVLRDCWANLYKAGVLFDVVTTNNEVNINNSLNMYKNMVLEDSKMLQVDITLDELGLLIDESYKKWARL